MNLLSRQASLNLCNVAPPFNTFYSPFYDIVPLQAMFLAFGLFLL